MYIDSIRKITNLFFLTILLFMLGVCIRIITNWMTHGIDKQSKNVVSLIIKEPEIKPLSSK